jgi:transcription antitermination factor NusG
MSTTKKARWYVVHVYSGHDKKIAGAAPTRPTLHLTDKIIQVLFLLKIKSKFTWPRKTVSEKSFRLHVG